MKAPQSLIANRYLYTSSQPLKTTQYLSQYKTYDKVTKRDLILQIHTQSDLLIDSLKDFKHPFIHFVFDKVQMDDGRVAYLFESGVQSNLEEALRGINHLNEEDALLVFKYILLMVKQVHAKNIQIKRLCLENIVICNYALFKLSHLIMAGDLPIEYKSPQQLQQKPTSFQSDIFSLGVMLYKMIYGQFPFNASQPSQLVRLIKSKQFTNLDSKTLLPISISRQVHYLILSMLQFTQDNRPDLDTILGNSCFTFDIETQLQKYIKPKGSIVPESFHKKYLIYRPSKIITKFGDYYSESTYLIFNVQEKTFMTLYTPDIRMFQTEPRKIQSYFEKIKAIENNYKKKGCEYLLKIDGIERFRQEPMVAAEYCNQGNLFLYLEKRKNSRGWLTQSQANVLMYLLAIALKQMRTLGITSVHTINSQRILIHNGIIKLREPGLLTPIIEKKLHNNQQIDYFAPQLKQNMQFVQLDKSDIWSYGVLYIYLLTGQLPKIDSQSHIDLSYLKTHKKNINLIGHCLDFNVKKRIQLDNIKLENIDENLLNTMLKLNLFQQQQQESSPHLEKLLDDSDVDSNDQEIKDNQKVMFKRRKQRLFKHYNKIISQSTTSNCRITIKIIYGLFLLWTLFFGIFFVNGGMGMLRTNFYRKITLKVPYNYGTSLINMTILSTNGALIASKYSNFSYQQFKNDLRCAQNSYSNESKGGVWDFINGSQTVYCLFGFIWAILISILYVIQSQKLDLPTVMVKRKRKKSNKQLFHLVVMNFLVSSLLFTFFYTYAFQYIIQMTPCLGIQDLAYPKFTSVDTILNGDMSKFFLKVFLTVILWAILMFIYGFTSFYIKKISHNIFEWPGIIVLASIMGLFTLICRVGFGSDTPIEPTWSYKLNFDITQHYFGLFGFFPEILWLIVFLGGALIDFIFWIFLKLGMEPVDQQDITKVQIVKAKFQKTQGKDKNLTNIKSNIYMIQNEFDFERFD